MSWSLLYCLPRTIANSTEMTLLIAVVWAWSKSCRTVTGYTLYGSETRDGTPAILYEMMAICLSAISIYARPTSLIMLVLPHVAIAIRITCRMLQGPIALGIMLSHKNKWTFLLGRVGGLLVVILSNTCVQCIPAGGAVLAACIALDHRGYRHDTIHSQDEHWLRGLIRALSAAPPVRFFLVNFLENKSSVFGVHPWHWHFSQVCFVWATVSLVLSNMCTGTAYSFGPVFSASFHRNCNISAKPLCLWSQRLWLHYIRVDHERACEV